MNGVLFHNPWWGKTFSLTLYSKKSKMNVLIIGATSGIGKALFEIYAAKGNRIGIVGRRVNLLDELYQRHPDNTFTSAADITK